MLTSIPLSRCPTWSNKIMKPKQIFWATVLTRCSLNGPTLYVKINTHYKRVKTQQLFVFCDFIFLKTYMCKFLFHFMPTNPFEMRHTGPLKYYTSQADTECKRKVVFKLKRHITSSIWCCLYCSLQVSFQQKPPPSVIKMERNKSLTFTWLLLMLLYRYKKKHYEGIAKASATTNNP